MRDTFWLRCAECRHSLNVTANEVMELVMSFKPALFPWDVPKTHPREQRHRCRACGFVTVLVPQSVVRELTTPASWRNSIVTK